MPEKDGHTNVAPRVGAWIETRLSQYFLTSEGSPLAWGRGLKLETFCTARHVAWSPLAWGRGLKPTEKNGKNRYKLVAPRVGAWIETKSWSGSAKLTASPLAWGRGLKQGEPLDLRRVDKSRPSRGGVD